jgi:hypothetical protein
VSTKVVRTLGALVVAAAPFVMFTAPAANATGGCSVDVASTSQSGSVSAELPSGTVSAQTSATSCTYVSGGGRVEWGCTVGRCSVTRSDSTQAPACVADVAVTCGGGFDAAPGATITLTVTVGQGYIHDTV